MTKISRSKKEFCFFTLFDKFIQSSKNGKRLQPNGKRYSEGTILNYECTRKLLQLFCEKKTFYLRFREEKRLNGRELTVEMNYWKKFYRRFTDFLYNEQGYFDNYIGQNIKIIKTFFNYLNKEGTIKPGSFHKQFYVRKEEIAIFPLMPEELNFFIYDEGFAASLTPRLQEAKDVFVFGCTVALRVSDLLRLKRTDLRSINGQHYLAVRSKKTSTATLIKLPDYCIQIVNKYKHRKSIKGLLPCFNPVNLNQYIKLLLEKGGFIQEVSIKRDRRGKPVARKGKGSGPIRFCDVASTHMMRRTAITSMLCLGMPEQLVRQISGHAPGSKDFYRYVLLAQTYQDQETEKVFEKLKTKSLNRIG